MEEFIITTTPDLHGYSIDEYLGPVIVPCVGAADALRDWFAGFRDFFGGRARGYQKTFRNFVNDALQEMIRIAAKRGANAVIGLRIETTNISAGKSMVSIMLYGTAVKISPEQAEVR